MATLDKQSKVSVEILIVLITLTVAVVANWIRGEYNNKHNTEEIDDIKNEFARYAEQSSSDMQKLVNTVGEIANQLRVQNALASMRMGDRWSASMEEESQVKWLVLMRPVFTTLYEQFGLPIPSEYPDIQEIQQKNLERLYNAEF